MRRDIVYFVENVVAGETLEAPELMAGLEAISLSPPVDGFRWKIRARIMRMEPMSHTMLVPDDPVEDTDGTVEFSDPVVGGRRRLTPLTLENFQRFKPFMVQWELLEPRFQTDAALQQYFYEQLVP